MVQAIFLLGIIVAPTLGPTLGGWITDNYSWNWCFFINVPIGIGSTFLVATFLKDPPDHRRKQGDVDWLGIALLTIGVGSLQYVLEQGSSKDWFANAWITRLAVIAGVSLIGMLVWELSPRNRHPVIELRVLKNRDLAVCLFLFVALGFALYGGTFMFPLFTQTILNYTPTKTGMSLMPGGLATAASALLCGRLLSGRNSLVDARLLIGVGVVMIILAMWRLGHLNVLAGDDNVRTALIIRGAALGLLFAPINNVAFGSLRPSEAQQASGLINLSRQLGGSFGIAILGTYLTRQIRLSTLTWSRTPTPRIRWWRRVAAFQYLVKHGTPQAAAGKAALFELDAAVSRQGAMLAYNSSWMLLLVSFLVVSPAIFLLRRPRAAVVVAEAH